LIDNKFVIEDVEKDKIDEESVDSEEEDEQLNEDNLKIHFTDESKNDIKE